MIELNESARDFLLYAYFGIVPEDIYKKKEKHEEYQKYCFKMIIIKAYKDATNLGAYNTLFKKEIKDIEQIKNNSNDARTRAANKILTELSNPKKDNYADWHNCLCESLIKEYEKVKDKENENPFFTYGNAQKWVNMTMKYLYLLNLLPKNEIFKSENLYIPIDSYILKALKNPNENIDLIPQKPWSTWDKKDYVCSGFRDKMKNNNKNLEWENKAWIEVSEINKNKDLEETLKSFFG